MHTLPNAAARETYTAATVHRRQFAEEESNVQSHSQCCIANGDYATRICGQEEDKKSAQNAELLLSEKNTEQLVDSLGACNYFQFYLKLDPLASECISNSAPPPPPPPTPTATADSAGLGRPHVN